MSEPPPVTTPEPPYYAVIFVAGMRDGDLAEYDSDMARLMERAHSIDGFIGEDALRGEDGRSLCVSYWRDEESISRWRDDADHRATKQRGRRDWYDAYELRIARVEKASSFRAG